MNKIHAGGVGDFLQIETMASECGFKVQLRSGFIVTCRKALDDERREHQARKDNRQNDSCSDALFHLGGALLSEF